MLETLFAWKRFNANRKGVASLEYVLLASLMVAITAAVFNSSAGDSVREALATGMEYITTSATNAFGGG